jgi:PAS domain-containing protein
LEADLAENQLTEIEEARAFAQAIIDTVREPILVLDQDLRVITASRSFYRTFRVEHSEASLAAGKDRTRARRDGGL